MGSRVSRDPLTVTVPGLRAYTTPRSGSATMRTSVRPGSVFVTVSPRARPDNPTSITSRKVNPPTDLRFNASLGMPAEATPAWWKWMDLMEGRNANVECGHGLTHGKPVFGNQQPGRTGSNVLVALQCPFPTRRRRRRPVPVFKRGQRPDAPRRETGYSKCGSLSRFQSRATCLRRPASLLSWPMKSIRFFASTWPSQKTSEARLAWSSSGH